VEGTAAEEVWSHLEEREAQLRAEEPRRELRDRLENQATQQGALPPSRPESSKSVATSSLRLPADRFKDFRAVNDWICQRAEGSAVFICECGSGSCLATLELSVSEYEEIRSNPTWCILNPGHELEGGRVIQRGSGFLITESSSYDDDRLVRPG
jgi:hypothetical protein